MERGASTRFVAEALGHGSDSVTKRHYIEPTALRNASIKRVTEALAGRPDMPPNPPAPVDLSALAATLRSLNPEQLKALLSSIASSNGRSG